MSVIKEITPLQLSPVKQGDTSEVSRSKADFGEILSSTIKSVNDTQIAGDKAIESLQTGEAKNLHEVMLAVEEADISLRMLVQMRNKALSAYDEMMRLQI